MNILILGSSGLFGRRLHDLLKSYKQISVHNNGLSSRNFNINNRHELEKLIFGKSTFGIREPTESILGILIDGIFMNIPIKSFTFVINNDKHYYIFDNHYFVYFFFFFDNKSILFYLFDY
jgi:hypothetical protein